MDNLNRNELFLIAKELRLADLLNFCLSSRRINELVCKRNDIWLYMLNKEYNDEKNKLHFIV